MSEINLKRVTKETNIELSLNIYGKGSYNIDTGIGFFDHMLETLARHANFDLNIKAKGDLRVDYHHTVEDVGIVLGDAFCQSLKNINIKRYGYSIIPMDEALVLSSVDLCSRIFLNYDCELNGSVKEFDTELIKEFFLSFVNNGKFVLHIKQLAGENKHHIIEAIFKSAAHSLCDAVQKTENILSTKGIL